LRELEVVRKQLKKRPDKRLTMTEPDARSVAASGRNSGKGVYNLQIAIDTKHHLVHEHEVTNVENEHGQLSSMALPAKNTMGKANLKVVADRSYLSGPEIPACDLSDISAYVPKPLTPRIEEERSF
jgi:hypothetical protein